MAPHILLLYKHWFIKYCFIIYWQTVNSCTFNTNYFSKRILIKSVDNTACIILMEDVIIVLWLIKRF